MLRCSGFLGSPFSKWPRTRLKTTLVGLRCAWLTVKLHGSTAAIQDKKQSLFPLKRLSSSRDDSWAPLIHGEESAASDLIVPALLRCLSGNAESRCRAM